MQKLKDYQLSALWARTLDECQHLEDLGIPEIITRHLKNQCFSIRGELRLRRKERRTGQKLAAPSTPTGVGEP